MHDLLTTILKTVPVGIGIYKPNGDTVSVNEKLASIIGGTVNDIVLKNFHELESWKLSGLRDAALRALDSGAEYRINLHHLTAYGVEVDSDCVFVPFEHAGEQQLMLMISDVTDRKRAEDELKKKNAEIEQLIYAVSHDLRSHLVTVKTFMGCLENDMIEGNRNQITQDIRFIHSAADRMKLMLDELLNMSRIDYVEMPPVKVSLAEVADEAINAQIGIIREREVEIRLHEVDLVLFGDRSRLCQVWQNLIDNAIKYTPNGRVPRIELGVRWINGETIFFVKDNGIGVDPRFSTRIFDIFEKLNLKTPGVGLGLSIIQRIVQKYGGKVWVESEGIDTGACFCFTLPLAMVNS